MNAPIRRVHFPSFWVDLFTLVLAVTIWWLLIAPIAV